MLLRFLPRAQWEKKLRSIGAEPLQGKTVINTMEWWRVPGQLPFTVPVEADGTMDFWALKMIVDQQDGPQVPLPELPPDEDDD